ncbi:MAG: CPBP family intramembrane metalloprotease [Bacteroidaceae bacterium]|nr:CPBP family intramembrane metalloprotease [Bacteroidaceae bacterium]
MLVLSILLAALLWFVMFSPWTSPHVPFWTAMTLSAVTLTAASCLLNRGWWRRLQPAAMEVILGAAIAVVLWGVFWVGDKVSQWMFDFARPQVDLIYGLKDGWQPLGITLALLFIIGPAEEIFWRAFVQERLGRRYGANMGLILATAIYTLVHIWSFNFMLVMAALTCGMVWGLLYRFFPRHLTAIIVSHALWDAATFVVFPI